MGATSGSYETFCDWQRKHLTNHFCEERKDNNKSVFKIKSFNSADLINGYCGIFIYSVEKIQFYRCKIMEIFL